MNLSVVGIGPDEQALRQLAAVCGVGDRVHFLGWRSREETLALMASSDVFVQPSLFEGHSLALIEAAKLGLPLIVSNVPSQAEAVLRRDGTPCALMHEHNDDRGLAACVSQMIADRAKREHFHRLALPRGQNTRDPFVWGIGVRIVRNFARTQAERGTSFCPDAKRAVGQGEGRIPVRPGEFWVSIEGVFAI